MNGYYTAAATGVFQGHKQGFWKQLGNRAESRSYRFCGLAVCVCVWGGGTVQSLLQRTPVPVAVTHPRQRSQVVTW